MSRSSVPLRTALATVACLGLAVAVLPGPLVSASAAPSAPAAPRPRVMLGTVGGGAGFSPYSRVESVEALAGGASMATVRVYADWDEVWPDDLSTAVRDHGQGLVLSVKARTRKDEVVPYAAIAAAKPGDPYYAQVLSWAAEIKAYGKPLWFSFNHEPDVHKSDAMGTPEDYVKAWRRIITIFRAQHVRNAEYVFIATAPHWAATDRRSAAAFYPGDDWVDDIAADGYNFLDCTDIAPLPWTDPATLFEAFRRFGAAHPAKGLMIAEFGSVEDPADPQRKAQWYRQLEDLPRQPGWGQLRSVAQWWEQAQGRACDFRIDTSQPVVDAWRTWAADPLYAGVTTVAPSTVRRVAAVRDGRQVRLTWDPAGPGGGRVTSYRIAVLETGEQFTVGGGTWTFSYSPGGTGPQALTVSAVSSAGSSRPAAAPTV